ncbi:MAG: hypothetical protein JJU29_06730 [Verrucomicrobia bacterium]|nr:hypothetical protein [Verrucomicrobiota bacterium]MCH8511569.1 hypothetical protein [Kiritimatiellia bacterium]
MNYVECLDCKYIEILRAGLLIIRDALAVSDFERASLEAEHIHDLPTLLGESNVKRHQYYYDITRILYMEKLKELPTDSFVNIVLTRHFPAWKQLGAILKDMDEKP